jgi:hypothetical protein
MGATSKESVRHSALPVKHLNIRPLKRTLMGQPLPD